MALRSKGWTHYKHIGGVAFFAVSLFLSGCTSGEQFKKIHVVERPAYIYSEALKRNITVVGVTGGAENSPLWLSRISDNVLNTALTNTLKSQGLFSEAGRYRLTLQMMDMASPSLAENTKASARINYMLMDTVTKRIVLNEDIISDYTVLYAENPIAPYRRKTANEKAIQQNFKILLERLSQRYFSY